MGIVRSKRAPTKMHPYGYMKDKFVWSLVSAVGIFCLGAGVTCAHGFANLLAPPQQLEHLGYGLAGAQRTHVCASGCPPARGPAHHHQFGPCPEELLAVPEQARACCAVLGVSFVVEGCSLE